MGRITEIDEALKSQDLDFLRREIALRREMIDQMVGRLYPSIISDEIQLLRERLHELGSLND